MGATAFRSKRHFRYMFSEPESYANNRGDDFEQVQERAFEKAFGNTPLGWLNGHLNSLTLEAIERDRLQAEKLRVHQNEVRLRQFRCVQECPKCGKFGVFRFEYGPGISRSEVYPVVRRCSECGHSWNQR
jgi:hypothetical protein